MKRGILALVVMAVAVMGVFASGGKDTAAAGPKAFKIGLIIESTVDDKGWGQAMHDAILSVKNREPAGTVEYSYSEKMKPVDAGSAARQYASQGYDLIVAHGAQFKNLVLELAAEFPKVTFAFGTNAETGPANVFTYMPMSEQTGYINGIIAGLITKSNIIGIVGPVDAGDSARYNRGFILGVKSVNPNADIKVAFTGSFADYVKAAELAHTQVQAGADVLTGAAQQATGALRAVAEYKDKPIYWLGQDILQIGMPEGFKVVAAASYDYAAVIDAIIAYRAKGTLGGMNVPLNFANKGFVYKFNDAIGAVLPPAAKAAAEKAKADITAETLKVDWTSIK